MRIPFKKSRLYLIAVVILILLIVALLIILQERGNNEEDNEDDESVVNIMAEENYEAAGEDPEIDSSTEIVEKQVPENIFSLSVDADIELPQPGSLARILVTDTNDNEYLVYEAYSLLGNSASYSVQDTCEETCLLDGVTIKEIKTYTENDATIDVKNAKVNTKATKSATEEEKVAQAEAVLDEKIAKLNQEIAENGLRWTAGKTVFARLSYQEKKEFFEAEVPNLQGAEFYVGGVFETVGDILDESDAPTFKYLELTILEAVIKLVDGFLGNTNNNPTYSLAMLGSVKGAGSSIYVAEWDWRKAHGANNSNSPYFDGNPDTQETGNGWMTGIKDQRSCGSCWAFAATGATEAVANLYYNQHINLDLAEQDALSCSGAGSCSGGWPGVTLDYYTNTGVVNEACFPYTATDQSCGNKCGNPTERIKIGGKIDFSTNKTNDNLKKLILENGPLSGGIYSWSHAMPLLGWRTDTDDQPIWIFKNSWGKDWGIGGYLYLKTPISNIGWTHALTLPITSTSSSSPTGRTIRCIDADGDGFYNWGLSSEKPASCPIDAPLEKDCDDSNPSLAVFDERYDCTAYQPEIYPSSPIYSFGNVPFAMTSSAKEITIQNRSASDITINSMGIEDTTHFSLNLTPDGASYPCTGFGTVILAGSSCSAEVIFSPELEQVYSSQINVSFAEPGVSDLVIPIVGQGSSDPETVCDFLSGAWVRDANGDRCFELQEADCLQYHGEINECDPYCPPGQICTQTCRKSCEF